MSRLSAIVSIFFFVGVACPLEAASLGSVTGRIQDQAGHPVSHLLVALLKESTGASLPVLTRSDLKGIIHLRNLEAGSYRLMVKSSRYRGPEGVLRILPGRTTMVTLVLQQLFQFTGSGEHNQSLKTLLRTSGERRLIFRYRPQPEWTEPVTALPRNVAFEIYTSSGLEGDHLVFPRDSSGGSSTNFALVESLPGSIRYVLAGQLNSGEDSLWRLRNRIEYPFSDRHSLRVEVGLSRMSFEQPSLGLLSSPSGLSQDLEFTRASATSHVFTVGVEDRLLLGQAMSLLWGADLTEVQTDHRESFLQPRVEFSFAPASKTTVRLLTSARRPTRRGSVILPDGDLVNLNESVYFSRVGQEYGLGTLRYYVGSVTRRVGRASEFEVAAYRTRARGGTTPVVAVPSGAVGASSDVFHLQGNEGDSSGYRVSVRRRFGSKVTASFSWIRGVGSTLDGEAPVTSFARERGALLRAGLRRGHFQVVATEVEAFLPFSRTHLSAVIKISPSGSAVQTLDPYSDTYETGNAGVNLFVRQILPAPTALLNLLGLDFLGSYKIEALLDVRNLTNEQLSTLAGQSGDVVLYRNPRTIRGGIAVRF